MLMIYKYLCRFILQFLKEGKYVYFRRKELDKISPNAVGIDTSTHYLKEIPGCHSLFFDLLKTPTVIITTRIIICLLIQYITIPII